MHLTTSPIVDQALRVRDWIEPRIPQPPPIIRPALRFGGWIALLALSAIRWLAIRVRRLWVPFRLPCVGDINGRMWARPVEITDADLLKAGLPLPDFVPSMTVPSILEITINKKAGQSRPRRLSEPLAELFQPFPELRVNVAFSCGKARPLAFGKYGDPTSPWFNVFAGYYQVDVRQSFGRPFGYQKDEDHGGCFMIDPHEIAILGKADWNYFSNYLYGVPLKLLQQPSAPWQFMPAATQEINRRYWDHLCGTKISIVSAYQSTIGQQLSHSWWFLNNLWRAAFGQPVMTDKPAESFFPTKLDAELYVSFCADENDFDLRAPVFRTYIFGGTTNGTWVGDVQERAVHNKTFLSLQMTKLTKLIESSFEGLGFGEGNPSHPIPKCVHPTK